MTLALERMWSAKEYDQDYAYSILRNDSSHCISRLVDGAYLACGPTQVDRPYGGLEQVGPDETAAKMYVLHPRRGLREVHFNSAGN